MRCPDCGAYNREQAAWCTQCYRPLGGARDVATRVAQPPETGATRPPHTPADRAAADRSSGVPDAAGGGGVASAPDTPREAAAGPHEDGRRFRRGPAGLEWRCAACEEWNPLDAPACHRCGLPFAKVLRAAAPTRPAPRTSEGVAVTASLLFPGLGHLLLGRVGTGLARAVLFAAWAVGGLGVVLGSRSSAQPAWAAAPLLVGAVVVWVGSIVDAAQVARGGEDVLLRPRTLFWLVIGVVGLLMVTLVAAVLSVTGSAD